MNGNSEIDDIVKGFGEGLVLPLIEAILSILIAIVLTLNQMANQMNPNMMNFNLPIMLGSFAIMNIAESLAIGLGKISYAIAYCIGALIGIALFATALINIYPQATESTIGVIIIVMIGIVLKFYMVSKRANSRNIHYDY
jgi:hypothetical protein